jgi:hypothetical protein
MHFEWGYLLSISLIHVVGQIFEWTLEASIGVRKMRIEMGS